jgi:hypothetical protein
MQFRRNILASHFVQRNINNRSFFYGAINIATDPLFCDFVVVYAFDANYSIFIYGFSYNVKIRTLIKIKMNLKQQGIKILLCQMLSY